MKVIYVPKGRAREYSKLACNLFTGCGNRCTYCYAPACLHKKRELFHNEVKPRKDILERLEKDLREMQAKGDRRRVLLCFTCDPYTGLKELDRTTRAALELFNKYDINFQVLTKNGPEATRDFDLYKKGDAFAVSLTFINHEKSIQYEPKASTTRKRIHSLRVAKEKYGIETWVSLEPIIEPSESLKLIDRTYEFVDYYKIGKINNFKLPGEVDWKAFAESAIKKLDGYGKSYYIKESLREYMI